MKARLVESNRERVGQDRARRDRGRRPEQVHRDRGLAAHRRRGRRHPHPRPRGRARAHRGPRALEGRARRGRRRRRARTSSPRRRRRGRRTSCRRRSRRPRPAPRPASGPASCARPSATTAAPTGRRRRAAGRRRRAARRGPAPRRGGLREASATGSGSWSASPASTATPTAPSRSRSAPATSAWRSSTRGSGSPRSRSPPSAVQEDVDVVGLSILSGSHLELIPRGGRAAARRGRRRCRWWSAGSSRRRRRAPARGRRRPRLHAQGLRDQPDHGRDRRAGRRAPARPRQRRARCRPRPADPLVPPAGEPGPHLEDDERAERGPRAWLRCYRCWSRDLEVQIHYDAILRIDPETASRRTGVDEVQEAVVQCLDCLHDQPHLTIQEDRVVPIEDRWERMVAGTPWVASCTVTVDQDQVETCSGPRPPSRSPTAPSASRDARVLHPRPLPQARRGADHRPPAGRALRALRRGGHRGARGGLARRARDHLAGRGVTPAGARPGRGALAPGVGARQRATMPHGALSGFSAVLELVSRASRGVVAPAAG